MHEAQFYHTLSDGRVQCRLCAHGCLITPGARGLCRVRENRAGRLMTLNYGRVTAEQADPVEKKPLFHFHPGSLAYSLAAEGCNFSCRWCQNWSISQHPKQACDPGGLPLAPEEAARRARRHGCAMIAYTYTEPTVFLEYAGDCARAARALGLAQVMVTNGYMSREALEEAATWLDAANIDLKSMRDTVYRKYIGARLAPVLDTLRAMKRVGLWIEVTTLVIPGINDDPAEWRDAARFLVRELGPHTPWHLSRYYPAYRHDLSPPTPPATLDAAAAVGREEGLQHVYLGNLRRAGDEDTCCARCGRILIRRAGYVIVEASLRAGHCPACGERLAGVGLGSPGMDPSPPYGMHP